MKAKTLFSYGLALWLAGTGLAIAQAQANGAAGNSIEALDVTQQGGKILVRVTTKEPLRAVPPNFTIASPARIAFDFPGTVNALGRSSQDVGQGELRSMSIVQGADRARLVLNLRRPVAHEATLDGRSVLITLSEATVKLSLGERRVMEVGEGNGPVNALDAALRKALLPAYPALQDMKLVDFKVRILDSAGGTAAVTRVMIESADGQGRRWTTLGVSPNIVDAAYNALFDAITFKLFKDDVRSVAAA